MFAAGLSTVLAGCYFLGKDDPKASQPVKKRKKKTVISRNNLIAFTTDFQKAMKDCRFQISMEEQQIMMNIQQQGMQVSTTEIHQHLMQSFSKGLKQREEKLYAKYNITEKSAKLAAEKYKDDPEYKKLMANINKQYQQITKQPSTKSAVVLELGKFKEIMAELLKTSNKMWDEIEEIINRTKKTGTQSGQQLIKYIQELIQEKQTDVTDALYEKFGIDKYGFESSLKKYHKDPHVIQFLNRLTHLPQQRLEALGVQAMSGRGPPM